ncbi:MAG: hypothetical protein ACJ746_18970 [Bryobacteraceae bacterium]
MAAPVRTEAGNMIKLYEIMGDIQGHSDALMALIKKTSYEKKFADN